jgi:hypothetical protein
MLIQDGDFFRVAGHRAEKKFRFGQFMKGLTGHEQGVLFYLL